MDALEALHTRVSVPKLGGEAPNREELDNIFKAALRAPDHGQLRPWRFLLVIDNAREKLGALFGKAAKQDQPEISPAMLEKQKAKPLRAPMLIVAIAAIKSGDKIPQIEQMISAGAAVQNMLLAAHAQKIGAMWRTGNMAYHPLVAKGLGLAAHEKIVGYLYLGRNQGRNRLVPELEIKKYFEEWRG